MRSGAVRNYLVGLFMVLVGFVAVFLGYFYAGTFCDSSTSACHFHAAFTIEPLPIFVGAVFLLFGVYTIVRARRSQNVRAPVRDGTPISGAELQASLARDMRAYFKRFSNPVKPSEFDLLMLSLFDSIEANASDIDATIEAVRSHVLKEGRFRRWKDQSQANNVWRKGDESLPWIPETWQLRINWARLRVLGPTVASYTMAPAWVAPADGHPC